MHRNPWNVIVCATAACVVATVSAAPAAAQHHAMHTTTSELSSDVIASLRTATTKYSDVNVALAEGYVRDPSGMCVIATTEGAPAQLGGMGVHYFRPDLLGLTGTEPRVNGVGMYVDFAQPSILVYEPQADGSHRLVAIENLVWAKAWQEAGNTAPPVFNGHQYYHMVDNPLTAADEAHGFEPHYELHIWVHRDNPAGATAQFNTSVTCPSVPAGGN